MLHPPFGRQNAGRTVQRRKRFIELRHFTAYGELLNDVHLISGVRNIKRAVNKCRPILRTITEARALQLGLSPAVSGAFRFGFATAASSMIAFFCSFCLVLAESTALLADVNLTMYRLIPATAVFGTLLRAF